MGRTSFFLFSFMFYLRGGAGFCNAVRRTLASDVTMLAPYEVRVLENTSCQNDEYIAHRIGLVPFAERPVTKGESKDIAASDEPMPSIPSSDDPMTFTSSDDRMPSIPSSDDPMTFTSSDDRMPSISSPIPSSIPPSFKLILHSKGPCTVVASDFVDARTLSASNAVDSFSFSPTTTLQPVFPEMEIMQLLEGQEIDYRSV